GLVRVWPARTSARPYEVWMVTHKDLRHTARMSAMIDHIVRVFDEVEAQAQAEVERIIGQQLGSARRSAGHTSGAHS
ncbi:MAG: hypothetical protein N2040_00535, partial [Caldimonas manganoxidans]|nr:hypothetical protein [Caldimonas manganoxidans]